jgi:Resolvase, N terminal domain
VQPGSSNRSNIVLSLSSPLAQASRGKDVPAEASGMRAAVLGQRLARSIGDLQHIVCTLEAKGASLKATQRPIDTSTAAGKRFLDMLGVFAEFETNLRRERQLEGIAKAKATGVYKGRPASIDTDQGKKACGRPTLRRPSTSAGHRCTRRSIKVTTH